MKFMKIFLVVIVAGMILACSSSQDKAYKSQEAVRKFLKGKDLMKITDNLHAFIWESRTTNNCNAYLIDGPTRVLIDPGHSKLFGHVELGLKQLGLTISDIGLVYRPGHLHPCPSGPHRGRSAIQRQPCPFHLTRG